MESKEEKEQRRRWQAEDDFRAIGRVAEIHTDKERMKAVMDMHAEHADMLKTVMKQEGITHKADNMMSEDQSASGSKEAEAGHVTEKKGATAGKTAKEPNYSRKRN
jgi:hypothetical protein